MEAVGVGGLDVIAISFQQYSSSLADEGESVWQRMECQAPKICKLAASTRRMENSCLDYSLERSERLRIPPIQPHPALFIEDNPGPSVHSPSHALLAKPSLVPDADGASIGLLSAIPPNSKPLDLSAGRVSPAHDGRLHTTNRMETIRNCLRSRDLPEDVINIMLTATRANTHSSYQTAWASWHD